MLVVFNLKKILYCSTTPRCFVVVMLTWDCRPTESSAECMMTSSEIHTWLFYIIIIYSTIYIWWLELENLSHTGGLRSWNFVLGVGCEFRCQVVVLFLWLPLSSCVVRKACTSYTSLHNTYWQHVEIGTVHHLPPGSWAHAHAHARCPLSVPSHRSFRRGS